MVDVASRLGHLAAVQGDGVSPQVGRERRCEACLADRALSPRRGRGGFLVERASELAANAGDGSELGLALGDASLVLRLWTCARHAVIDRLAAMPVAERREVRGLEPERAPVILGGLLVLAEVLAHFGLDAIETSECDILDGIALMAGRIALDEGIEELPEPFGRTVC